MKLIDKDAILAEIKKRIKYYQVKNQKWGVEGYAGRVAEGEEILDYINTLEVKEVDLKEEIDKIWKPRFNLGWDDKSMLSISYEGFGIIAKHFFELGLKEQKWIRTMTQITIRKIEDIYNLQSRLADLEHRLRASRSWLLREYITMDWNKDGRPEHTKEVEDELSESLRKVNECLDALGLGKLELDIHGYVTDIVRKAKGKKEVEELRAEKYLDRVWNDQTPHERKKLMTAYLDGMLAADISKDNR